MNRLVRACGAALLALASCSNGPSRHERVVVRRLLWTEGGDRFDAPRASSARYRWSVEEILSSWVAEAGANSVTLGSPPLGLPSLDAVDRITVSFQMPVAPARAILLWSTEPVLSHADFLRNRRELLPDATGMAVVRGKDLRAHEETPLRHLFVHLTGTTDPKTLLESIAVATFHDDMPAAGAGTNIARVMLGGEMRDALHLKPGASWSRAGLAIADGSSLRFGLSIDGAARLRLSVVSHDARTRIREWAFEELEGGGGGWREHEVTLPPATSASIRVEVESDTGASVLWGAPLVVAPSPVRRPNVVLYVVDSLRADVLGLYGGDPETSPFLDALGEESLVIERCYAAASWTKPAVASLLTSLYPGTHGLGTRHYTDPLPDDVQTLADYFREAGYVTVQLTANPFSGTLSNLDSGFDQYFAPDAFTGRADAVQVSADEINARLLPWLEAHADDRFFVYVQSVDPHPPFSTARGEELAPVDAYRAAVRSNDEAIARLYRHLEHLGLAENTLFVVTSDHGEAFGEHALSGHGQSVYEEEVRVPLVLHWPEGIEASRSGALSHHVDVLPTLLDLASIPFESSRVEGRSLERVPAEEDPRPVFVSRFVYPDDIDAIGIDRAEADAVVDWPWKLIVSETRGAELYELSSDPAERRNLTADHPERVAALRSELEKFLSQRESVRERLLGTRDIESRDAPRAPSPEVLEQLRRLGYIR